VLSDKSLMRSKIGTCVRKAEFTVGVAVVDLFRIFKMRLIGGAGNRLITPRANGIDRRILVLSSGKRNKARHSKYPLSWPKPSTFVQDAFGLLYCSHYAQLNVQVWPVLLVPWLARLCTSVLVASEFRRL